VVFLDLQLKVVLLAMFVRLEIKPVLFWIVSEECCCQASSVEVSDSMAPAAPPAAAGPSVNVQTQHRQYCHRFWLCIECKRSMCSVHSVDYVVERCLCVTCQHMLHFPGKQSPIVCNDLLFVNGGRHQNTLDWWAKNRIKCKKLISLQHRVRAMKSHIQNSTNHFFLG